MAEKVIHPDTGEPVTKKFARDMGFLDEAEPAGEDGPGDAVDQMAQDMDDFMESEPDFGDVQQEPEGEDMEDFGRRLEDIGEEPVRDEDDFFGEGFGPQQKPWDEGDVTPFYTNNTRPKRDDSQDEPEPEIDKREEDWEDKGQTYENTDLGGIRVRD